MANISSQAKRSIAGAKWYFTRNQKKRREHREYVAMSATGGATAGAFFEQMERVHAHYGKDEYVPAFERLSTGGYAKDDRGHRVPKVDSNGLRVYEPKFVQYYSLTQGFGLDELDPDDPASWDRAQELGRALASAPEFDGHMGLVVTEIGGNGKLHNHLLIDAVNRDTGASLQSSKVTHHRLAKTHDRVLAENGFEQRIDMLDLAAEVQDRQRAGEKGWSYRTVATQARETPDVVTERQDLRHEEWVRDAAIAAYKGDPMPVEPFSVDELKRRASEALHDPRAASWTELQEAARERHLLVEKRGKNVSFGMMRQQADGTWAEPAKSDRRRGSTLGDEYSLETVEQTIERSRREREQALEEATPLPRRRPKSVPEKSDQAPEKPTAKPEVPARRTPIPRPVVRPAVTHEPLAQPAIPVMDQERLDGLLELQETYRDRDPDKGVETGLRKLGDGRSSWLTKPFLDTYGDRLEPRTRDMLYQRTERVEEMRAAVAANRDLASRYGELTERHDKLVEQGRSVEAINKERVDVSRRTGQKAERFRSLKTQIEAGDYHDHARDHRERMALRRRLHDEVTRAERDTPDQGLPEL